MMTCLKYSNIGNRKENQDFVLIRELDENKVLYLVADGMGGYSHGSIAAKSVAESIADSLSEGNDVEGAVSLANHKLHQVITECNADKMGCCLSGLLLDNGKGIGFWVGDCRIYQFRKGEQIYVTEDHSLVAQLEKHKKLTIAQKERYGHIVSRAIMGGVNDTVDQVELDVQPNDEIILCTDGIHKGIPIDALLEMIHTNTLQLEDSDFDDNNSFTYIRI